MRLLIKAVSEFTNSRLHVSAFSMGAGLARKAVLGGRCVDRELDLGPPLGSLVDVFMSVAGVQQGALFCDREPRLAACADPLTGMACGSRFLQDINAV